MKNLNIEVEKTPILIDLFSKNGQPSKNQMHSSNYLRILRGFWKDTFTAIRKQKTNKQNIKIAKTMMDNKMICIRCHYCWFQIVQQSTRNFKKAMIGTKRYTLTNGIYLNTQTLIHLNMNTWLLIKSPEIHTRKRQHFQQIVLLKLDGCFQNSKNKSIFNISYKHWPQTCHPYHHQQQK